MTLRIGITKRTWSRPARSGDMTEYTRYIVSYRDPRMGKRVQLFFERHKDALEKRNDLITQYGTGGISERRSLTVRDAVDRWIEGRQGEVKARTLRGYREAVKNLVQPIVRGTRDTRAAYTRAGAVPAGVEVFPSLGDVNIQDLTPFDIRKWHKLVATEVGLYAANRAKMFLKTALQMAAEDFNLRLAVVPKNTGRGRSKAKKAILMPEQVALVLKDAQADQDRAIYLAFPFLTGVRPSEQLGLLWDCVDFEAGAVHIRRIQEDNGDLCELTKTEAGRREIPMSLLLRQLLLEWRVRCPRVAGQLCRVFPAPGIVRAWPQARVGGGGPLTYANFRKRFWIYGLKRLALPLITPHSARHTFISTMQAQGVEVGLVAKLAGHANPTVTLGHYTQAVRGGAEAVQALERAFGG